MLLKFRQKTRRKGDMNLVVILPDDSFIRATINYLAFFKLQDILLEFKNESILGGFAPATAASPDCDSHLKSESAGIMRISVIRHVLSRK
jgi:hypothetical protein